MHAGRARARGARNFHELVRIDGQVPPEERHARVERFQSDPDIPLALLTSQVGGLGLTLTAADRVVIYDPAWNPAADSQSVDRAYRIGQTRAPWCVPAGDPAARWRRRCTGGRCSRAV